MKCEPTFVKDTPVWNQNYPNQHYPSLTSQAHVPSNVSCSTYACALRSDAKADATMHGRMFDAFSRKLGLQKKIRCHVELGGAMTSGNAIFSLGLPF